MWQVRSMPAVHVNLYLAATRISPFAIGGSGCKALDFHCDTFCFVRAILVS